MKRMHVNIRVNDLAASVAYYSRLFGSAPTVEKGDYAKWMLEEPRVNFALSATSGPAGIEHLGIQVDSQEELEALFEHTPDLKEEGETTCCYAHSNKGWSADPQGVEWELFYTHGQSETYFGETGNAACCAPGPEGSTCCGDGAQVKTTGEAACC